MVLYSLRLSLLVSSTWCNSTYIYVHVSILYTYVCLLHVDICIYSFVTAWPTLLYDIGFPNRCHGALDGERSSTSADLPRVSNRVASQLRLVRNARTKLFRPDTDAAVTYSTVTSATASAMRRDFFRATSVMRSGLVRR